MIIKTDNLKFKIISEYNPDDLEIKVNEFIKQTAGVILDYRIQITKVETNTKDNNTIINNIYLLTIFYAE